MHLVQSSSESTNTHITRRCTNGYTNRPAGVNNFWRAHMFLDLFLLYASDIKEGIMSALSLLQTKEGNNDDQ